MSGSEQQCRYCQSGILPPRLAVLCTVCKQHCHVDCLSSRVPSGLEGDLFYDLTCRYCSSDGTECFTRTELRWYQAVHLLLYHLHVEGKHAYLNVNNHILPAVDKYWKDIFGAERSRPRHLKAVVSGILSQRSEQLFRSGSRGGPGSGWWKLIDVSPPVPGLHVRMREKQVVKEDSASSKPVLMFTDGLRPKRKKMSVLEAAIKLKEQRTADNAKRVKYRRHRDKTSGGGVSDVRGADGSANVTIKHDPEVGSGTAPPVSLPSSSSAPDNGRPEGLEDYKPEVKSEPPEEWSWGDSGFSAALTSSDLDLDGSRFISSFGEVAHIESVITTSACTPADEAQDFKYDPASRDDNTAPGAVSPSDDDSDDDGSSRGHDNDEEEEQEQPRVGGRPKLVEDKPPEGLAFLSGAEEKQLLVVLEERGAQWSDALGLRQLLAKLRLRRVKRERGLAPFDVDAVYGRLCLGRDTAGTAHRSGAGQDVKAGEEAPGAVPGTFNVLDRFQRSIGPGVSDLDPASRDMKPFPSPYTARTLKPYIWQDNEARPLRMRLLHEVKRKADRPVSAEDCRISYSYIRRHHVSQINDLLQQFFWPSIDCSESLLYPDVTCVALYKGLVVGLALAIPDVSATEAYLSFLLTRPEWRGAGVASFMLYQVAGKCSGKDLTLHVSATNPAVMLYQEFGFKTDRLELGFYERYYPETSSECKHALFMRLKR